jgi:protein-glutamine gamma-glutamyltransferase
MTLERRAQGTMLLCVMLSIASLCTGSGSPALALVLLPIAYAGWMLTGKGTRRILPPWVLYTIVLGALVVAAWRAMTEARAVGAFGAFLCAAVLARLWDRRTPKDDAQVLMLCAFLMIGSILEDQSLLLGVLVAAAVPTLMYAALLQQVRTARVRAGEGQRPDESRLDGGALAAGGLGRVAVLSLAVGILISTVVFLVMPRELGRGMLLRMEAGASPTTGFSNNIRLGKSGLLQTSQTQVLDLVVRDRAGRSLGADGRAFYLRGITWDLYGPDGSWGRSASGVQREDVGPQIRKTVGGMVRPGPGVIVQEVLIRRAGSRVPVFAGWRPIDVEFDQKGEVEESFNDLTMVRTSAEGNQPLRYRVVSDPNMIGEFTGTRTEDVGFDSPAVHALASQILREGGVDPEPRLRPFSQDAEAARLVERYLREKFQYTLELEPPARGQDPIEDFLFRRKRGHCEYFASAMTGMLRSVGINARLVGGYVAMEFNQATGAYIVRESNAHAWVEAEVQAGIWRQFDPTPPMDLRQVHQPEQSFLARVGRLFDTLEYAWIDSIVTFDESSRLRVIGEEVSRQTFGDRVASAVRVRLRVGGWGLARDAGINAAAAFVISVLLGFVIRRIWNRTLPRLSMASARHRARHDAGTQALIGFTRARAALKSVGFSVPPSTPIGLAIREQPGHLPGSIHAAALVAIERLYALCFGPETPTPAQVQHVEQGLRELERACRVAGVRPVRAE